MPLAKRREIINDATDFQLANSLFMLIRERDGILRSLSRNHVSGENISKAVLEIVRESNTQIAYLAKEVIDIDWTKYNLTEHRTQPTYPSYLVVPLLIIFSLTLTYLIEALLYGLLVNVSYDTFISKWLFSSGGHRNAILLFFTLSFGIRSLVAFFMLRIILVRIIPVSQQSFIYLRITKIKLIFCSVVIMGLPSVYLPLEIFTFGAGFESDKTIAIDPNVPVLFAMLIPIFDVARMILSIFILRSRNYIRMLYLASARTTLSSGLIHLAIGMILLVVPDVMTLSSTRFGTIVMVIGLIQIGLTVPMAKQSGHKWCLIGILVNISTSTVWIIILTNISIFMTVFRDSKLIEVEFQTIFTRNLGYLILSLQIIYIFITSFLIINIRKRLSSAENLKTLSSLDL